MKKRNQNTGASPLAGVKGYGASLTVGSFKFTGERSIVEGRLTEVCKVVGKAFRGTGEKTQTRCTLQDEVGSSTHVYLPERWADILASWVGSGFYIRSSNPGKADTRYDVRPADGAKKLAKPVEVLTVRRVESDTPRRAKGKARGRK